MSSNNDIRQRPQQHWSSHDGSSADERRARMKKVARQLSFRDFVDPSRPWVLVPEGSLGGFFDWVPEHLRKGPWSVFAPLYLASVIYLMCVGAVWKCNHEETFDWWQVKEPYRPFNLSWCYNVLGFMWTVYMCSSIWNGPMGARAWATYTVQSWTLLTIRHGLCALVPFVPKLLPFAEGLRFPALASATITFVVFNLVIGPFIYFIGLKNAESRQRFLAYFTSFRLIQIHVFNIVYAILNCIYASPFREIHFFWDFYFAALFALFYALFYLLILDRVGVHTYPVFSPRSPFVMLTWTGMFGLYGLAFYFWKGYLSGDKKLLWV